LRSYNISEEQLCLASKLACSGLLCYQPFVFSNDVITGAGYEFAQSAEGAGLVHTNRIPKEFNLKSPGLQRHLIDSEIADDFKVHNEQLSSFYQSIIDMTLSKTGEAVDLTFADVGSNCGYFPLELSKRGAKKVVGFDSENYTEPYKLLNSILSTSAEFQHTAYDPVRGEIPDAGRFDVVFSVAVLLHLSDPLAHLAFLGKMAKKALFVWTPTSDDGDDELVVRYHSQNRYYENSKFPHCFDVVILSPAMLRRSLELMGFTEIHELKNTPAGLSDAWFEKHTGYLAIRPDSVSE